MPNSNANGILNAFATIESVRKNLRAARITDIQIRDHIVIIRTVETDDADDDEARIYEISDQIDLCDAHQMDLVRHISETIWKKDDDLYQWEHRLEIPQSKYARAPAMVCDQRIAELREDIADLKHELLDAVMNHEVYQHRQLHEIVHKKLTPWLSTTIITGDTEFAVVVGKWLITVILRAGGITPSDITHFRAVSDEIVSEWCPIYHVTATVVPCIFTLKNIPQKIQRLAMKMGVRVCNARKDDQLDCLNDLLGISPEKKG